jgi:hypothetical protein
LSQSDREPVDEIESSPPATPRLGRRCGGDGARHRHRCWSGRRLSTPGPTVVPPRTLPSADIGPSDEDDIQYSSGAHQVDHIGACSSNNFSANNNGGADAPGDNHDASSDDINV